MSTLSNIKKMADEIFPGSDHDLPHLLYAWCKFNPGNVLGNALKDAGFSISKLLKILESILNMGPDPEEYYIFDTCTRKYGPNFTGFHLMSVICKAPESIIFRKITSAQVNMKQLSVSMDHQIDKIPVFQQKLDTGTEEMPVIDSSLYSYGCDLNAMASEGEFDGLADRQDVMDNIIDVLLRKTKRNAVLTGFAGVGKTSIVQLLARKIAYNEIQCLNGKCVFELNIGKIVSGTKYRGDFEKRFYDILDMVTKHGRLILFIDEFHLLIGAGSTEGVTMDASNLLKPYLSGDTFQVIGATTCEEYDKYIRPNAALERRFQEINLDKPDTDLTRQIIKRQARILEDFHGVQIPGEFISEAIKLTDCYISHRSQPDKSMDLLDIASAGIKRMGKSVLTIEDIYRTLSNMVGIKVVSQKKNAVKQWVDNFHNVFFKEKINLIFLSTVNPKQMRDHIHAYLGRLRTNLLEARIELEYEEERLVDFLHSELMKDNHKGKKISSLVDQKILEPIAGTLINSNFIDDTVKFFIGEDFYINGKVSKACPTTVIVTEQSGGG